MILKSYHVLPGLPPENLPWVPKVPRYKWLSTAGSAGWVRRWWWHRDSEHHRGSFAIWKSHLRQKPAPWISIWNHIGSMQAIYGNMASIYPSFVSTYTIHGSSGFGTTKFGTDVFFCMVIMLSKKTISTLDFGSADSFGYSMKKCINMYISTLIWHHLTVFLDLFRFWEFWCLGWQLFFV